MSVERALRRYGAVVAAILGFVLVAAAVAVYILDHQRLRWPWEDVTRIYAEFPSGQSVSPGQGQQVTIAGVQVGEIGKVELDSGRALLRLDIDPGKSGPIYRNARFALRPKTGLNDMSVQVDPGTPQPGLPGRGRLRDGDRVGAAGTQVNVNPDEVLASLDADTRRYLTILANAGGEGLAGRGLDLRRVLAAAEPTLARTRRVAGALADRRAKVRRLVANLRTLASVAASRDRQLASLVDASSATFATLGDREAALAASVRRLPGALGATTDALRATRALAAEAGPALEALRPAARRLAPALVRARPLLRDATPIVRSDLRPLVREATPLLGELRPALVALNRTTPDLIRAGRVLNYVANELGYNPPGSEEGYLFWTAWFFHNASSILSIEDANGVAWRGMVQVGCSTVGGLLSSSPLLAPLSSSAVCP